MKQYKNYIFSIFFCICSLFSTSFFRDSYVVKPEFGKPKDNIVLLSAKKTPASHYIVMNQEKSSISMIESFPADVFGDLPKIESYFIRFFEEKRFAFQKPEPPEIFYSILARFPSRVLRN